MASILKISPLLFLNIYKKNPMPPLERSCDTLPRIFTGLHFISGFMVIIPVWLLCMAGSIFIARHQVAMSLAMGSIELIKIGYLCIARRYRNIFFMLTVAFFF